MPIYEYNCHKCGESVERYEGHVDEEAPPTCCSKAMVKLMSAVCFDLRGSGFYENDYGKGAHKLTTTQQAQRASVDCKNRGLVPAQPGKFHSNTMPSTRPKWA